MKIQRSIDKTQPFHLGARWGMRGQRHAPAALPTEKRPATHGEVSVPEVKRNSDNHWLLV
jgi:hypothetical protein